MLFQSQTIYTHNFEAIDANKGLLKGVVMVSEGEAKGHGVKLNKAFIRNVVKLSKEQDRGVKARFGHPNMCTTALGTYLGVFKNPRLRKEKLEDGTFRYHSVADLQLSNSAKDTPNGNLFNYVTNLATERPDMFGASIAFEGDSYEGEENGNVVRYATIKKLYATDLVDDPAATEGLFSEETFAGQVTNFLDNHPKIFEIINKKPEIIDEFLNKYKNFNMGILSKNKKKVFSKLVAGDKEFTYEGELKEGIQLNPIGFELEAGELENKDYKFSIDEDGIIESLETIEQSNDDSFDSETFRTELLEEVNGIVSPLLEAVNSLNTKFDSLRKNGSKGDPPKGSGVSNGTISLESASKLDEIKELRKKAQEAYSKKLGRA